MPVLPIHIYGQPVLRKKAKPIKSVDPDLVGFVESMFETMTNAHGIGLAANQVGILRRVIVVDLSGMEDMKDFKPLVLINPEVGAESGSCVMEEGCLSIPEVRDEVERPEEIRVRFRDLEFKEHEMVAEDLLARVILHEIDHLNGVLFIDRIGTTKQKLLTGRLNKLVRGEVEATYPVVTHMHPSVEFEK
jgi:peptide deformylase